MAFTPTLSTTLNCSFDSSAGRRGRRQHALGPSTFDPLQLGDDLLLWWDPETGVATTGSEIDSWTDRKAGAAAIHAGTGTGVVVSGGMVQIGATAFLFNPDGWNFDAPFEIWQVVDQTEAAGSSPLASFALDSGPGAVELQYTPDIGGQSSALINGTTTYFGGDNYHGVHVVRWQIFSDHVVGWMDRQFGLSSATTYSNPLEPAPYFIGADPQGMNLWKGRIGDTVATRALSSGEVGAVWNFLMGRAGL